MEYVGGTSLKQILKDRMRANGGTFDPLPVDQALAYILEILPAFSYLHDLGLIYCDFKPDNLIQVGDAVKLIDLGGVRRIDDHDSAIYGTVGYQAPEVAQVGTTVASDIYTIGRTLVVLMMEFRGYQTRYVASLPPVDGDAAVRRARLAVPAAGQGVRDRPGGPVRLGRRVPGAAAGRAAGGRRGEDGRYALDLGRIGAVRGTRDHQRSAGVGRAAVAADRHQRPAVRLAEQHLTRRPRGAAGGAAPGAGGVARGLAGPGACRFAAAVARTWSIRSSTRCSSRSVGVAGGLDERPVGTGRW